LVIDDIVSQEQSTFIKGRQIMEGPLILNEVISWCKARKEQLLMFKVDFQKAFDSVRWDHLDDILGKYGFEIKWREWIRGCLQSSKASVLVDGSPTDEFSFHRGLRQGDPLSPFLFILVMESLHVSFQRLIDRDDLKITWVCWNKVLAHKNKGGLGVNSLYALNLASIFKWIWRFLASSSSLWIKVIKSIHGNSGDLDNPYSSRLKNSTWIGILKAINKLKVKGKFKRLFNLELQKDANVAYKLQASNVASSFRRPSQEVFFSSTRGSKLGSLGNKCLRLNDQMIVGLEVEALVDAMEVMVVDDEWRR
nr:cysteine-rich receptor-like protein kinase [Tanacetum cinerariifolium]